MPAPSVRARVRAEMIDEIKAVARRHLATDGANLSLRAVARDMGMVSSAVYRYFASRDDLLTALIIDAYNALGDAVERADSTFADPTDLRGRFFTACRAIREWALANPSEYALVFGSPVPGYQAPEDTIAAAARTPLVLIRIVTSAPRPPAVRDLPAPVSRDFQILAESLKADLEGVAVKPSTLIRASIAWTHVFGAISFELFGQLNNVVEAREQYFELQVGMMADLTGLQAR